MREKSTIYIKLLLKGRNEVEEPLQRLAARRGGSRKERRPPGAPGMASYNVAARCAVSENPRARDGSRRPRRRSRLGSRPPGARSADAGL